MTILERFWEKVSPEPNSGCWLWTAADNGVGYGLLGGGGRNKKNVLAHRFSYEVHKGPIPHGMVLDHKCRTPSCVNPDHLDPVTHRENCRRGHAGVDARQRAELKTHCKFGHSLADAYQYPTEFGGVRRSCRRCRIDQSAARVRVMRFECSAS